jgi:ABC-type antimicrobial peptide transport system permease subunit
VAIVNEAFARTYFGRLDILGQTIALAPAMKDDSREIVGVVANVKARSNSGFTRGLNALAAQTAPAIYVPAAQAPDAAVQIANRFFDTKWIVKTRGPVTGVERDIEATVGAVDATLPFVRFESMTSVIGRDLDLQRLMTVLLGAFATAAMLLAAVGLYGLVAYSAVQRRQEIGLRIALGATRVEIVRSFLRDGLSTVAVGLAIGMAGAALTTRVLSAILFGVTPLDKTTFIVAASGLVLVATCASWIPAAGAARIDPVEALRDS